MEYAPNRRQFLGFAGTGAAVSVAGCSDLSSTNDDADADGDFEDEDVEASDVSLTGSMVTALLQPDPEELEARQMELQQEIQQQVEDGEIEEMEAQQVLQQESQEIQLELIEAEVEAFESEYADDDSVTIEHALPEQGAFLLDAEADRLIEILNEGAVSGLLPGEEFVTALEQQEQQEEQEEEVPLEPEAEAEPEPEP